MKHYTKLFLILAAMLSGCLSSPDFDELSYDFIVSTNVDKKANFKQYKTYYISNRVVNIGGQGADSLLTGPAAQQLIETVKTNMAASGYQLVTKAAQPDLGLTLSVVKIENLVVDYWPGWWDSYWPWCYWGCYPYYYTWSSVYSYSTGTMILNMYDLKNAPADAKITGLWNITALGSLGSSATENLQRGVDAINQGFLQSKYLNIK